jgi:hypothetical protein
VTYNGSNDVRSVASFLVRAVAPVEVLNQLSLAGSEIGSDPATSDGAARITEVAVVFVDAGVRDRYDLALTFNVGVPEGALVGLARLSDPLRVPVLELVAVAFVEGADLRKQCEKGGERERGGGRES